MGRPRGSARIAVKLTMIGAKTYVDTNMTNTYVFFLNTPLKIGF